MQNQENLPQSSHQEPVVQQYQWSNQQEWTSQNYSPVPGQSEQAQEYAERPYTDGYPELNMEPGEKDKIRAEPLQKRGPGGFFLFIGILCAILVAANIFGLLIAWLSWSLLTLLIISSLCIIAMYWRVVTFPIPPQSFQVTESPRLKVHNYAATISIRRGENNVITVAGIKKASGIGVKPDNMQVNCELQGNTLNISTNFLWNFFSFGFRKLELEITVPATCAIDVDNGSGRANLDGINGEIRLRTGSGRIEASNLQGRISLKTGSGSMSGANLNGQVEFKTGSGSISGTNISGQATFTTGSGRIEIEQARLEGNSQIKTGSGSITFDGALDPRGSHYFKTGSGGVKLNLPANAAFSLNSTTGSGSTVNEFGNAEVGSFPRAQIKIRTGSGGIRVQRGAWTQQNVM